MFDLIVTSVIVSIVTALLSGLREMAEGSQSPETAVSTQVQVEEEAPLEHEERFEVEEFEEEWEGLDSEDEFDDLTGLSLEQLLDIEVVSVARKATTVPSSPAAIYVITKEDIRRSGHSSIPEILRMATGLHVARVNGNTWAIAARGFNGRFNNKMLVMVDGRTIFTNLFSGVYWDVQDLHLNDIERIEVIRGPGGTQWGVNAVNGVINIITKHAKDTQGTDFSVRGGTEDRGIMSWRHGQAMTDGHWRVYAKAFARGATELATGEEHHDEWSMARAGFRADWTSEDSDTFTLQGDVYGGSVDERSIVKRFNVPPNEIFEGTSNVQGANILGRWTRTHEEGQESQLQAYLDYTSRTSSLFDDKRGTLDLDFTHRQRMGEKHDVLWGAGYRVVSGDFQGSPSFDLTKSHRTDQYISAFIQDDITLRPNSLNLTIGSKIEHNDFTGLEVSPSLRLLWLATKDHTVWASVSRAVRIPSVVQDSLLHEVSETVGPTTNVITRLTGNTALGSDELIAYETGWRFRLGQKVYVDLTAFLNDFAAADNFQVGATIDEGGGNFVVPVLFDNARQAEVRGFEASIDMELNESWQVRSGFTLLDLEFDGDPLGTPIQPRSDAEEPNYVANLRSSWNLSEHLDLDLGLYAVDRLDDLGVGSYLRVDSRLAYRPSDRFELIIGAQNLLDDGHSEFATALLSTASEIERSFYLGLEWNP